MFWQRHVPRAALDKLGWNDGLHNFLVKTAKFQTYTSISQNCWDQKVAAILKLPVFDVEENDELEKKPFTALRTKRLIS